MLIKHIPISMLTLKRLTSNNIAPIIILYPSLNTIYNTAAFHYYKATVIVQKAIFLVK